MGGILLVPERSSRHSRHGFQLHLVSRHFSDLQLVGSDLHLKILFELSKFETLNFEICFDAHSAHLCLYAFGLITESAGRILIGERKCDNPTINLGACRLLAKQDAFFFTQLELGNDPRGIA